MQELGNKIKTLRENQGLTIADLEQATKIRGYYLRAIEAGRLEQLPEKIYALGFVGTYMKQLGVDEEDINQVLEEYKQYYDGRVEKEATQHVENIQKSIQLASSKGDKKGVAPPKPIRTRERSFGSRFVWVVLLLVIVLSVGFLYFIGREPAEGVPNIVDPPINNGNSGGVPPITPDETDPGDQNIPQAFPEDNPSAALNDTQTITGVQVKVSTVNGPCWVRVTIDGTTQEETIPLGEARTYVGNEAIKIKYGNAGAIEVEHNGTKIESVGKSGSVVTQDYGKIEQ